MVNLMSHEVLKNIGSLLNIDVPYDVNNESIMPGKLPDLTSVLVSLERGIFIICPRKKFH
jgi:hypothetical protein